LSQTKWKIEEILNENVSSFEIAQKLKKELREYSSNLKANFEQTGGKDFLSAHTKYIDEILMIIYHVTLREAFGVYMPMKHSIPIGLVALGSYGREQLCLFSDIDVMIVYDDIEAYNTKALIEKMLYILWDTGLKIGHRVHKVDELLEVSKEDITIKTAILESRYIEGSKILWTKTQNAINAIRHDGSEQFIKEKIEERRSKREKFPFSMTPNIKEGVGGFRDANLVFWIAKIIYNVESIKQVPADVIDENEYKEFRIALEFLFRLRVALHITANKKEDVLGLEIIPETASLLGYKNTPAEHMKFAKKTLQSMNTIDLYCTLWVYDMSGISLIKQTKELLYLPQEKNLTSLTSILQHLIAKSDDDFYADISIVSKLVRIKKPSTLSKSVFESIKKMFYKPHAYGVIETIYRARLLSFFFPPFKKVTDLPQFDGYHQYPVDLHSIKSVWHLENIKDDFIRSLFDALDNDHKALLKLVTLLHDTGKGRSKDHSETGVLLFRSYASKLGFDEMLIKLGEKLILHHILMSKVAQREDLHNERIILDFASKMEDKRSIDMLYVLTYADISGVGEERFTPFVNQLLNTLYYNALEALENRDLLDEASKRSRKIRALKKNRSFLALDAALQKKIVQIPANLPFLRYSSDVIVNLAVKSSGTKDFRYWITNKDYLSIEIVRETPINLSYLLANLSYLDVGNMEIAKLFDGLKYFKIDYISKIDAEDINRIEKIIENSFDATLKAEIKKPFINTKEIAINFDYSQSYLSMHINTKNQMGLIAYVAGIIDEYGMDISSAKIQTNKNRAIDLFLIEKNGNFRHNMKLILKKLTEN
jgi:[protein-PII] uridylyltransferase